MPESHLPVLETIRTTKQQICFQQNSHIDEIPTITSFIGGITYIPQNITNLPVHINIPLLFESSKIKQDKELEEFLRGEIHCQNLISQNLTFLQPPVIHAQWSKENKITSEENTTETSPIETPENIPLQEQDIDLQQPSAVDVIYDRNHSTNPAASIQPVEPVVGLTPEEQQKKEADPNLTQTELLYPSSNLRWTRGKPDK